MGSTGPPCPAPSYTVTDRHRPLGFASKVIAFPHLRGALIGSGIYEIQVAAAAALMGRPELFGFDDVLDALPGILRAETDTLAAERGIFDTDTGNLFHGRFPFDEIAINDLILAR
jgi:hypothetical protein